MKNITLLCDHDVLKRPRPFRILEMLKQIGGFELSVIARECSQIQDIATFSFPPLPTQKQRSQEESKKLFELCKNREFDKLIFTPNRLKIPEILHSLPPQDLLIVEDITLLPFAFQEKQRRGGKILIDLREYYPLEYENSQEWLEGFGKFFTYLCEEYLSEVDYALCVSEGILARYQKEFGIEGEVFLSLPPYFEADCPRIQSHISIIYHGFVSPDRSSANLLEFAKSLPYSYKLYLLALSNQPNFLESLQEKAHTIKNLIFLPPVAMNEIIPSTRGFDIGLIPFMPTTFNLKYCMPNKLFEYIQAGLCVLSTPLPEIKHFLDSNKCGVVARDFSISCLLETLLALSKDEILEYKNRSLAIRKTYSLNENLTRLEKILYKLKILDI